MNILLKMNCILLLVLSPIVLPVETLRAQEIILQNDNATEGQPGALTTSMRSGDMAMSWFRLPENVDSFEIKEVQIGMGTVNNAPSVSTFGEMGVSFGDYDFDGDVDKEDLQKCQSCLNQSTIDCLIFDNNFNYIVDDNDFSEVQKCYSGTNIPADINCGNFDEHGQLKAPQPKELSSVMDVYLYCHDGAVVGYMGGNNLTPNALHRIPVVDVEYAPNFPKTGKKWIVNRKDGDFAIAVQYIFAIDSYGFESEFDENSAHIAMDNSGCIPEKNYAFLFDRTTGYYDFYDFYDFGSPGNLIIRVVGEANFINPLFGDYDKDGDLDQVDFGALQLCYNEQWDKNISECTIFDCNRNNKIDDNDISTFMQCFSGPNIPANPDCGNCNPIGLCEKTIYDLKSIYENLNIPDKYGTEAKFPVFWSIVIGLILTAMIYAGQRYWSSSRAIAEQRRFIAAARCKTADEELIATEAIALLRDTWAYENWSCNIPRDPIAKQCGQYLWGNEYYKNCQLMVVDQQNNPTNLVAVQPVGTNMIVVDARIFEPPANRKKVATVLFAEWCHIWNKGGRGTGSTYVSNEGECQRLLEAFYNRHGQWIDIHHGNNEGRAD